MDKISLALQLILSLSILVVLHEFGHFLPARWFKTRVEKFYLFFNPYFSLFKKQIGETEWGIGWVPFGGYVKIAGMIDESMDKEQMKQPAQPWEFRSKKAWQRLIIMVGGVTVNFLLGILIFSMIIFYWGESYLKVENAKYGMAVDSLGMQLGLADGDIPVSVGGIPVTKFSSGAISKEIVINQATEVVVNRGGQNVTLNVPADFVGELTKYENKNKSLFYPRQKMEIDLVADEGTAIKSGLAKGMTVLAINGKPTEYLHEMSRALQGLRHGIAKMDLVTAEGKRISKLVAVPGSGKIGVGTKQMDLSVEKFGLMTSFAKGWKTSVNFLGDQLKAFGQMFSGKIKAKDSLGSVFSIATMFDSGWDWREFWNITASLSILLAFFNLLPIPALDGGYVVFLLWEIITGKEPGDKFMEVVNYAGFFILMALMIFALGLDISRWF